MEDKLSVTFTKSTVDIALNPLQINTSQSDITRMSSDYADNELELFRKTVSYINRISNRTRISSVSYVVVFLPKTADHNFCYFDSD